ncbi:ankyrin repeat protein, putative [Bodo saltans]|uniref:Ankyrin repeat protein, putative n=1 Tax=Bodo saltans TaxID=75058 RepID=A0A0S4JDA0_BODSA|nr:ankyrin repeat protein, putative [Bodo saltans]|eukprot:CUG88126.1 ankyrin repeat protein, putative [Bodo saltans]
MSSFPAFILLPCTDTITVRNHLGCVPAQATSLGGATAMHLAAKGGRADIITLLANNGGNVDATKNDQVTPLHIAAANGHTNALLELLRLNATVNVAVNGKTPLHSAALKGHMNAISALLDHHADVAAVTNDGTTAMHAAAQGGHADIITLLANNGGNVDAKRSDHGGDVNALRNGKATPLHLAAANGHIKALLELLNFCDSMPRSMWQMRTLLYTPKRCQWSHRRSQCSPGSSRRCCSCDARRCHRNAPSRTRGACRCHRTTCQQRRQRGCSEKR